MLNMHHLILVSIKKMFTKVFYYQLSKQAFNLFIVVFLINIFCVHKVSAQENITIDTFEIFGDHRSITKGADGFIWFLETDYNNIGKMSTDAMSVYRYSVPTSDSYLQDITLGLNGEMWFSEANANKIGKINSDGSIVEEYVLPYQNSMPWGITLGPDDNIWFTEYMGNKVGKIDKNGQIVEFIIPTANSLPTSITSTDDLNIWFAESNTNKIGKLNLADNSITEFITPSGGRITSVARGADSKLWYSKNAAIGFIDVNGSVTEYPISYSFGNLINDLILGSDGNIWYTKSGESNYSGYIGRIKPDGIISEYLVPVYISKPFGITSGPDGNIWFGDSRAGIIGRVNMQSIIPSVIPSPVFTPTPTVFPTPTLTPTPTQAPENILNVPYFSQNDDPWGSTEYDHTISKFGLSGISTTMNRWGCAVTSAAMIMHFHNIKEFPDGTPINPGTLNDWLKNNEGYVSGYSSEGWYSSINFPSIGVLSEQIYAAGKSDIKLTHERSYFSADSSSLLNDDLTVGNSFGPFPDIIRVNNNGHFVVAKGKLSHTYAINDPEWNYNTLSSFNNTYSQIDRFIPSQTNLSYIILVVGPDVEILVSDGNGRKTGKTIQDGQVLEYKEIPNATYAFSPPIENTDSSGDSQMLGTGVNEFLLPVPEGGRYVINLSGKANNFYTLNVLTYQKNGENISKKIEGIINNNYNNIINIEYSQVEPSVVNKIITFYDLKADLKKYYNDNLITSKLVYKTLLLQVELAEKASLMYRQPLGNRLSILALRSFQLELNRTKNKYVKEEAYRVLYEDAEIIIKNLKGTQNEDDAGTGDGS